MTKRKKPGGWIGPALPPNKPIPMQRLDEAARFRFMVLAARAWAHLGKAPARVPLEPNDDDTGGYGINAQIINPRATVLGVPCHKLSVDVFQDDLGSGVGAKSARPLGRKIEGILRDIDAVTVVHSGVRFRTTVSSSDPSAFTVEAGTAHDVWGYWPLQIEMADSRLWFNFHLPEVLLLNRFSASLILRHNNHKRYWLTLPV